MARFSLFFEGIKLYTPRQLPTVWKAGCSFDCKRGVQLITEYRWLADYNSKTMEYIPLHIFP